PNLRLDVNRRAVAARDVTHPEEAEDERDRSADRHCRPADDEADEDAGDANGEARRPEARRRPMLLVLVRVHRLAAPFLACPTRVDSAIQTMFAILCQRRNRWRDRAAF